MKIEVNTPLSKYTTFQLGGPAAQILHCATPEKLITAVKHLASKNESFILIGGGSNIVVSDKGLHTDVIRYFSDEPIITHHENELTVSGSTILDDLAFFCAEQGLDGLNYCSGIPGTVGGAVVGNAGAYGKQVGDVLKDIKVIDHQGEVQTMIPEQLNFRYRHSDLKENNLIVLEATFIVTPGDVVQLQEERTTILKTRQEKHPHWPTEPCAGSFFRNIEATSDADRRQATGGILDEAGGKSLKSGGAFIYPKHANIITKNEQGTAQDIYDLHLKMKQLAKEKFDLDLQREVRFVGEFDTDEKQNLIGFW